MKMQHPYLSLIPPAVLNRSVSKSIVSAIIDVHSDGAGLFRRARNHDANNAMFAPQPKLPFKNVNTPKKSVSYPCIISEDG